MANRDRVAIGLVAVATAAAILPVAGAVRMGALACALACAITFIPYVPAHRRFPAWPRLALTLGLMAVATALQVLPLPAAIVSALSPHAAAITAAAHQATGQPPPSWMPLSLSPAHTLVELAKVLGYLTIALTALRLAESRAGRHALRTIVAVAAIVLVLIACFHRAADEKLLYGVYQPITYSPKLVTPFINVNHLAGFLVACAAVCTGLALETKKSVLRTIYAFGAAAMLAISFAVPSRGAAVGLVAAVSIFVALTAIRLFREQSREKGRGRRRRRRQAWLPIAVILASVTLLVALLGDDILREFSETTSAELSDPNSKFGAWRSATAVIAEHPITGIGRGAFESVFTAYHDRSGARVYSHVENEFLQSVVDHGVFFGTAILVMLVWTLWLGIQRGVRSAAAAGTAAAIAAIAGQNLFDFSLALPGTAVPWLLLAASVTYGHASDGGALEPGRIATRAGAVALVIAIATLAVARAPLAREVRAQLRTELAEKSEAAAIEAAAWPTLRQHPADGLAYAEVARALFRVASPRAFSYLGRALALYPTHQGTLHLAARMMRAAGRDRQALGYYRRAIEFGENPREISRELLATYSEPRDLLEVLPTSGEHTLAVLRGLRKRPAAAFAYGTRLIALGQGDDEIRSETAAAALELGEHAEVIRLLKDAGDPDDLASLAAAYASSGDGDHTAKTIAAIAAAHAPPPDRVKALERLARHFQAHNDPHTATAALNEIASMADASAADRARARKSLAKIAPTIGEKN